jgi:D-threo-aldose 1-dehydrogenase
VRDVRIGADGPSCSRVGLGTHSLHRLPFARDRRLLLAGAYDLGVRYFDTAPSYGAGLAEREIGRLAAGRRSTMLITTKFGIAAGRLASVLPGGALLTAAAGAALRAAGLRPKGAAVPHRDYGAAAMSQSVEGSLRRLRTETIDILYLHAPSLETIGDPEPLLEALGTLRQAGKIRRVGLSGAASECLAIARRYPALADVLQMEIPADSQGLPVAGRLPAEAGVGFWEFPSGPAPRPEKLLEQLRQAMPAGVILLSTRRLSVLAQAVAALSTADAP